MSTRRRILFSASLALGVIYSSAQAAVVSIVDLGTLGGTQTGASAINSSAQVTGSSTLNKTSGSHAFLWSGGVMTDLFPTDPALLQALGADINDSGQIVGQVYDSVSGVISAYTYKAGVLTNLGTFGEAGASATAVNNSGQMVVNAGGRALLVDGGITDLGSLPGYSSSALGLGINNQGTVVGTSSNSKTNHAFVWDHGVMSDLGTLGGTTSSAGAINDAGQIVGIADTASGDSHAVLWQNGIPFDLGTLYGGKESLAADINNNGAIVGYASAGLGMNQRTYAFLYSGGVMIDLNQLLPANSGWDLRLASGINDKNQIIGLGTHNGQQRRAFLLTLAVPEPSTYVLAGVGAVFLTAIGVCARRRHVGN